MKLFTRYKIWLILFFQLFYNFVSSQSAFLFKDINTNTSNASSNPEFLTKANNLLFFSAFDGENGIELWATDGKNTFLVKDIYPGPNSSSPIDLIELNGVLYFSAVDPLNGRELWRSDGTETGTYLVKDLEPGVDYSSPRNFIVCNGLIFFQANYRLWKSDGTTNGTSQVVNYNNSNLYIAEDMIAFNNKLYFNGNRYFILSGTNLGQELWETDGTEIGTKMVSDIRQGTLGSYPNDFFVFKNKLFFLADNGLNTGYELHSFDGNSVEFFMDLNPGPQNTSNLLIQKTDSYFYFLYGSSLWRSDGTNIGTVDFFALTGNIYSNLTDFKALNNNLFFSTFIPFVGEKLYVTDGNPNNIQLFFERNNILFLNNFNTDGYEFFFTSSINYGDGYKFELWEGTNVTTATKKLKRFDSILNGNNSYLTNFIRVANRTFFTFDDLIHGQEIWVIGNQCTTTKSGQWDDPTVWSCGVVPTNLDDVIISPTHIITMPGNYTGQANNLENNGNLIFLGNSILQLTGQ